MCRSHCLLLPPSPLPRCDSTWLKRTNGSCAHTYTLLTGLSFSSAPAFSMHPSLLCINPCPTHSHLVPHPGLGGDGSEGGGPLEQLQRLHPYFNCLFQPVSTSPPTHAGLGGDGSEGGWEMEDLELPADLGLDAAATAAAAAAGAPFVAPTPGVSAGVWGCMRAFVE